MALKTTNIEMVKDMYRKFIRLPLGETAMYPMVVAHPIFDSGIYPIMDENKNIKSLHICDSASDLEEAIDYVEKNTLPFIKSLSNAVFLIKNPYKLAFLKYCKDFISKEDFSSELGSVWCHIENGNQDVNVSVYEIARWFKACDKDKLMLEEERAYLDSLPEEITVYRGVGKGRNPKGLSWTEDYDLAMWFAKRWKQSGYIIKGKVKKSDVLAYFSDRAEAGGVGGYPETELVIPYNKVMDKETVYEFTAEV